MKTGIAGIRILLVFWLLVACTSISVTPAARIIDNATHILVSVEGTVEIRRRGWVKTAYTPARFGTQLHPEDRIRMAADAWATVICADLTKLPLLPDDTTAPCPVGRPMMTYKGVEIPSTRTGSNDFPQVVYPRKGKVMNTRPTLHWVPLPGAADLPHEVEISGDGFRWQVTTSGITTMTYPADQPSLRPGEYYELEIRADNSSSRDEGSGLGFYVVTPVEAQIVEQAKQRILELELEPTAAQLLLAHLYRSHDFYYEALEQLYPLAQTVKEPAVELALADLYAEVELMRLAATHYQAAVRLAQTVGDHESEARARQQLGRIYLLHLGNPQEALDMLTGARALYEELGDAEQVAGIDEYLAAMQ